MRQKDHKGEQVSSQNIKTLSKLVDAVDHGDCVALFPEGVSRYASQLAPLKTGIARVAAQVLQRHAHEPDFRLCVTTTSLTYLHRANFRSNVLLVVNAPIVLTPGTHPDLARPLAEHAEKDDPALVAVRALTSQIDAALRSGTLDSPSWRILRVAHTARRIHEPIESIHQSLGDYVRSTQRWIELFVSANAPTEDAARMVENERIIALGQRLHAYQDRLGRVGVKDARIAEDSDAWLIELSGRLLGRVIWCCILGLIALPGLVLWLPILVFAKRKEVAWRKRGPTWDVIDEVAQTKVMNGLLAFVCVWFGAMLLTLPVAAITFFAVPIAMWFVARTGCLADGAGYRCAGWRTSRRLCAADDRSPGSSSSTRPAATCLWPRAPSASRSRPSSSTSPRSVA